MSAFILRRLLQMIPLMLGISFLTFAIINLIPNSPVSDLEFNPRTRPEDIARIKQNLGLNEPWPLRYVQWISNLVRGDLGISLENFQPVNRLILDVLPNTLLLAGSSLVLALAIAIPIGIYSATHRNSLFDHVATVTSIAAYAMPSFWLALLFIILFGLKFREWGLPALPVNGMSDLRNGGGTLDRIEHMILPVISLSLVQIASWARYIRSSMLEVVSQDYVRTAASKGLRDRAIVYGHAFRNALLPLITLVGLSLPELFGGAFFIESIFAWPGVGLLTLRAITSSDYPVIMGTTVMFAALTILGNLLADVLFAVLDPRIRYD